jgi:hypothetical protein
MNSMYWALAQAAEDYPTADGGGAIAALFGGVFFLIWLVVVVAMVAGMWKVFEKAGEPGWAALVPIYNIIELVKISGKEMWWVIVFFVCGPIAAIVISLEIAKKFGQGMGFGLGLAFLPFIFYPMLGFGSAQYNRNA